MPTLSAAMRLSRAAMTARPVRLLTRLKTVSYTHLDVYKRQELARRCVIQGKADGSFGYADPLQRCDGAVLLLSLIHIYRAWVPPPFPFVMLHPL